MVRERNSECWYHSVCNMDNSCDACIRYVEMKFLMDHSGLPKAKQKPIKLSPSTGDYEAFCDLQDIKDNIVEFVNNGKNLYIGGTVGNGKTSWAIKLLLKYFDEIWAGNGFRVRGLFVHVPTLLAKLKNFDDPLSREDRINLSKADLIIWDEIGDTGMSNYDYTQLIMILNDRMLCERSNIFTSNLYTKADTIKHLGDRLSSRVWNTSEIIILKGKDRR